MNIPKERAYPPAAWADGVCRPAAAVVAGGAKRHSGLSAAHAGRGGAGAVGRARLSRLAHAGHRIGDRQRAGAGCLARRGAGAVHDLLAAPAALADAAGAHQPGDTGVRPGPAAGAVVRLRHERQGGDGGAGDLLPVVSAFFDGLRRVNNDYLDLARTMRASRWRSCGTCG